jgi:hypothetical protein
MINIGLNNYVSPGINTRQLDTPPCKCGTRPKIGDDFLYDSPYGSMVEGIIGKLDGSHIVSTKNVRYLCSAITIITRQKKRAEKLISLINDTE